MDLKSISVTPPLGHNKGQSLGSDVSTGVDFAAADKRSKIRQWIEDIDQIDNFHSRSSVLGTELNSVISSEDSRYDRNADSTTVIGSEIDAPLNSKDMPGLDPLLDDDFDAEDDFFVDAALSALDKGRVAFDGGDFLAADAYLREALVMIKELAKKQQSVCDTWELRRMLGVCAFHVHSAAEAEQALVSVLENAPKNALLNEAQRLHVAEAAHLLSQVCVKLGRTDKAYRYCEYALRGRRKVLGKTSEQSYDSLALLSRILELQNNNIRAEFFVGMIPEAERQAYVGKFSGLSVTDASNNTGNEILPSDAVSSVSVQKQVEEPPSVSARVPKLPQRSPSRGSMSPSASAVSALRPEEIARPVSALSHVATAKVGDLADTRTVSSVSAAGSPPDLADGFGSLPPQTSEQSSRAQRAILPGPVRPDHIRALSQGGLNIQNALPSINEPASPSQLQEQLAMFPQPLRLSQQPRQAVVSELPGDNHYSQQPQGATKGTSEMTPIPQFPDPPRSVPSNMEVGVKDAVAPPVQHPQSVVNDRDRLPSRSKVVSAPRNAHAETPTSTPQSDHNHEERRLYESQQVNISGTTVRDGLQQSSSDAAMTTTALPANNADPIPRIRGTAPYDILSVQPTEQPPPVYEDVATQYLPQSAPVMPDAQRSDFQNTAWTPPLQTHAGEGYGNVPFMPPTNDFARQPPAPPPPTMPNVERWAVQYVAPSASPPVDRRSIASSSYSESISTVQSHGQSTQNLPSTMANLSQQSSKTSRKGSLLKVFRNNSSPATTSTTAARTSSINFNGVRLTRADTDSIKNDVLTDAAIDFWQEHLEQNLTKQSAKHVLMRPMRAALLLESSNDPTNLKAALPNFVPGESGTLHIFIPLRHPKKPSHCSLLLVSPQDGLACHYDPRQPWNRKVAEDLTSRIAIHYSKPLEFLDVGDVPQVTNEKDSGVFVCMFMQHLILKLENTHVSEKVNAGLECRVDGKSARKTLLKQVDGRRKSAHIIAE